MAEKILIIEDDDSIATLTRLQLESRSFLVQIARNGAEGLRQAYGWQPDLVLFSAYQGTAEVWERLLSDLRNEFSKVADFSEIVTNS